MVVGKVFVDESRVEITTVTRCHEEEDSDVLEDAIPDIFKNNGKGN